MPGPSLIGLTGGIAAGKSEVLRILDELGAETLSTDVVVHELLGTEEVRELLVGRWGERVAPEGALDRGRIAGVVFEEPGELSWLESILHPRVGARVLGWRQALAADVAVAVVEVPLLFEGRMAEMFDATIAVIAEDGLREQRASERGTGELDGRSSRQLSQAEKAERATFVVHNNGTVAELEAELQALFGELAAASG
ncbi:MAG: dephospho-CoA kinase [Solirubrobacterales bacterium]